MSKSRLTTTTTGRPQITLANLTQDETYDRASKQLVRMQLPISQPRTQSSTTQDMRSWPQNLRGTQYKHYTYGTTLGHLASPQETQQTSRLWGIWRDLMREENVSHCQNSVLVEHVANEGCHASVSASTSSVSATVVDPICHCGAVYEGLITIKIK